MATERRAAILCGNLDAEIITGSQEIRVREVVIGSTMAGSLEVVGNLDVTQNLKVAGDALIVNEVVAQSVRCPLVMAERLEHPTGEHISTPGIEVDYQGLVVQGKSRAALGYEVDQPNKGFVAPSPNGHRWRYTPTNTGAWIGEDLDA